MQVAVASPDKEGAGQDSAEAREFWLAPGHENLAAIGVRIPEGPVVRNERTTLVRHNTDEVVSLKAGIPVGTIVEQDEEQALLLESYPSSSAAIGAIELMRRSTSGFRFATAGSRAITLAPVS